MPEADMPTPESDMKPFHCNVDQFKEVTLKFIRRCQDHRNSMSSLEGAKTTFFFHFLHCEINNEVDQVTCVALWEIGMREFLFRQVNEEIDNARAAEG